MTKVCDNKSAGEIIRDGELIVMIERRNYPQAFALPAGHLDGYSFEDAAQKETKEEVGVDVLKNEEVYHETLDNPCKREGGTYHEWKVFEAKKWKGQPVAGDDAKSYFWASPQKLRELAERTEYFMDKYDLPYTRVGDLTRAIFGDPALKETDPDWKEKMGLEPLWYYILKEMKVLE